VHADGQCTPFRLRIPDDAPNNDGWPSFVSAQETCANAVVTVTRRQRARAEAMSARTDHRQDALYLRGSAGAREADGHARVHQENHTCDDSTCDEMDAEEGAM
jgi:hypothetical protein